MQMEDFRGLTPFFFRHFTPYCEFQLDMNKRINLEETILIIQVAPECSGVATTPYSSDNSDCQRLHSSFMFCYKKSHSITKIYCSAIFKAFEEKEIIFY